MKWKRLAECPDWSLMACYGSGKTNWAKMCSAVAETFGEDGVATHIHFYTKDIDAARRIYKTIKNDLQVNTIRTFSIENDYSYLLGYSNKVGDNVYAFYKVSCEHECSVPEVKEVFFLNNKETAESCAAYSVSPYGGWDSVTLEGLDELPEGVQLNEEGDWY